MASYAAWLAGRPDLARGTAHFAVRAVGSAPARQAAAAALAALSVRSAAHLAAPSACSFLPALTAALVSTLAASLGSLADGTAAEAALDDLVATAARTCGALPAGGFEAAQSCLEPVMRPLSSPASLSPLAASRLITLTATSVRFASFGEGGAGAAAGTRGAAAAAVASFVWPAVSAAAELHAGTTDHDARERLATAVGDAIGTIVRTAGPALGPALPALVDTALQGFERSFCGSYVDAVSAVCECFGPSGEEAALESLARWLDRVNARALPGMAAGEGGAARPVAAPETVAAVLELQRVAVLFAPGAVAQSASLAASVRAANALLGSARHPRVLHGAAALLETLGRATAHADKAASGVVSASASQLPGSRGRVWAAMRDVAPSVVATTARCPGLPFQLIIDTCGRALWGFLRSSLAETLSSGRPATDDPCARALAAALGAEDYPTRAPELTAAHRSAVGTALLGLVVSADDRQAEFSLLAGVLFRVANGTKPLEELAALINDS